MSTRYGRTGGQGSADQAERKDEGWQSRQGGRQSHPEGRHGESGAGRAGSNSRASEPPPGTNTQGELAGIRSASEKVLEADLHPTDGQPADSASGTDQPVRMGGPLGPDPRHPHLPEGIQTSDTQGSGAGGFDRGVNAKSIGEVHQGARPEDDNDATFPGEPGVIALPPPKARP
jgi:hypothetical protein